MNFELEADYTFVSKGS